MAQLIETGAEARTVVAGEEVTTIVGSPIINTSMQRSGGACYEFSGSLATLSACAIGFTKTLGTELYGQYSTHLDALETGMLDYFKLMNSGQTVTFMDIQIADVAGIPTMTIYYNDYGSTLANTAVLTYDTTHVIEWHFNTVPAGGSEVLEVKVDNVTVASSSTLTHVNGTPAYWEKGIYNGSAGTLSASRTYADDILIFDISGSHQNSWPGGQKLVLALPTGAGDNAANAGLFSSINEIPPSTSTATPGARIDLDTSTSVADYVMTDSAVLGIDSYDTIKSVSVITRLREETSLASGYQMRVKSASGATVSSSTAQDAGTTIPRTNPTGTTAFANRHLVYTDPTTGLAWTPTGTNSIDSMQVGMASTTDNDIWVLWLVAYIAFTDGTPPPSGFRPRVIIF